MNAVLHVSEKDNLVTCLRPLKKGEIIEFEGKNYTVQSDIPVFHKMAVAEIKKGEYCYKYGEVIGRVGATGLTTGPHLHYELKFGNVQINPMTVRLPDTKKLTPYQFAQMEVLIAPLRAKLARLQKVQVSSFQNKNASSQTN